MKKINTFWNWFQDNHHTFKNIINETTVNQKHITFWINKSLNYYCRELDFIIVFPKKVASQFEFIITANGNKDYFHQVLNLVDKAPQLKTWKFTAFIQLTERIDEFIKGLDQPYIFPDITLKASKLIFLTIGYHEISHKLDIVVFLKNYNVYCDTKTLKQALFIVMRDIIGEKSPYQNSDFVQLAQAPDIKDGLIKLYDLQLYIDGENQ